MKFLSRIKLTKNFFISKIIRYFNEHTDKRPTPIVCRLVLENPIETKLYYNLIRNDLKILIGHISRRQDIDALLNEQE